MKTMQRVIGILVISSLFGIAIFAELPANNRKWVKVYQHPYSFGAIEYLLYVPPSYTASTEDFPLILNFHGAGQKGRDAKLLEDFSLPAMLAESTENDPASPPLTPRGTKREDFPFLVVSPQLPGPVGFEWPYSLDRATWPSDHDLETVYDLVQHLLAHYAIDESRIYGVGASMGGYTTWKMAMQYPDLFAAISPQCGEGDPENAAVLKDVPAWVFHGNADEIMPFANSQAMVDGLKQAGGSVTFTTDLEVTYPDGTTDANNHASCYNNSFDELWDWLLTQSKSQ